MPRQARRKSNSGIYHVMLRGIDRATIFHDDEDCEKFLDVLRACRVPLAQPGNSGDPDRPAGWGLSICHGSAGTKGLSPATPDDGDRPIRQGQSPATPDDGDRPIRQGQSPATPDSGDRPIRQGQSPATPGSGDRPIRQGQSLSPTSGVTDGQSLTTSFGVTDGQSLTASFGVTEGQSLTTESDPATWAKYYAYCLMGNHVHLLLQEGVEPIQQIIKRIGVRYASYYNWKYLRSGHLFQDRFRSEPVEDDRYFLAVFRYIALNPVKAGLCARVGEYSWGSWRGLAALGTVESLGTVPQSQLRCDRGTVPNDGGLISPPPLDVTPEQLDEFIRSDQPNLNPFPERISDREAAAIIRQTTGLAQVTAFQHLPKNEQKRFFAIFQEECLSIQQMARLTGVAKSNIARYLA